MATPYRERPIADPVVGIEDKPYFEAAERGKLLLKRCEACGRFHHYPRNFCPFCFSDRVAWHEASGRGTIHSYSVTRRAGPVPYCIAYVALEEGVVMMTNIVDCDLDDVRIGQKVRVTFKRSANGTAVPMFTPE